MTSSDSLTESPVNGNHFLSLAARGCECGRWSIPDDLANDLDTVVELYALHVAYRAVHSFSEALLAAVLGDLPLWAMFGPKSRRVPAVSHSRLKQLMDYVYVKES